MTQVSESSQDTSQIATWRDLVRSVCISLAGPPSAAGSATLSEDLSAYDESARRRFINLAQRLGEEYGLTSNIEERGAYVTVRFSRPAPIPPVHIESGLSRLIARFARCLRRAVVQEGEPDPMGGASYTDRGQQGVTT